MADFYESGDGALIWLIEGDADDIGGAVGQDHKNLETMRRRYDQITASLSERMTASKRREYEADLEYLAVELAAAEYAEQNPDSIRFSHHVYGFVADTKSDMARFKRVCNTALKAERAKRRDVPWPEWAIKATAEGWKPPKGWKP